MGIMNKTVYSESQGEVDLEQIARIILDNEYPPEEWPDEEYHRFEIPVTPDMHGVEKLPTVYVRYEIVRNAVGEKVGWEYQQCRTENTGRLTQAQQRKLEREARQKERQKQQK